MQHKLDRLRGSISNCLATEKSYNLPSVCLRYSLDDGDESEAFSSKNRYVITRLKDKEEKFIVELAKKLIDDYQSYEIGFSLNKYLNNQYYLLSQITRNNLIEELLKQNNLSGKLTSDEFLQKFEFLDHSTTHFLEKEEKDTLKELFKENIMHKLLDSQFFEILEQLVHPFIRPESEAQNYLKIINPILSKDDLELIQQGHISGSPFFKVIQKYGVKGIIKNF